MKIATFARSYPIKNWDKVSASDLHYSRLVDEDFTAMRPDGSTLFVVRKKFFSPEFMSEIEDVFAGVNAETVSPQGVLTQGHNCGPNISTVGFFEKTGFWSKDLTEWSEKNPERWERATKLAALVWRAFSEHFPRVASIKLASIAKSCSIPWTGFSSITIERNNPREYHKDDGNFRGGMTTLVVSRKGDWSGCRLVFPEFRLGIELDHADFVSFDSYEFHGNTPLHLPEPSDIRSVYGFYLRELLQGSAVK